MKLRDEGWDMQQRIAQLAAHPGDVDTLRALLPVLPGEPVEQPLQGLAAPERSEEAAVDEALFPWPDDDRDDGHAPGWDRESLDDVPAASNPSVALPVLPTRFERQRPEPFPSFTGAPRTSTGCGFAYSARRPRTRWRSSPTAGAAIFWACTWSASIRPMPLAPAGATPGSASW